YGFLLEVKTQTRFRRRSVFISVYRAALSQRKRQSAPGEISHGWISIDLIGVPDVSRNGDSESIFRSGWSRDGLSRDCKTSSIGIGWFNWGQLAHVVPRSLDFACSRSRHWRIIQED